MTPAGVIHGGWGFVIAAYSISVFVLLGYAVSVHLRYMAERARRQREAGAEVRS